MRIRIDTEQVRTIGRRLDSGADEVREIEARLRAAARRLSWESRSRLHIEDDVWAASRRAGVLADDLSALGGRLARTAERFESADNAAIDDLGAIPWNLLLPPGVSLPDFLEELLGPDWADVLERLRDGLEDGKYAYSRSKDILELLIVAIGLSQREGSSYPGQVIISGPEFVKKLAGLHPHLTHLRYGIDDILKQSANLGWDAVKGAFSPVMIGLDLVLNGYDNWQEYRGDFSKIAVGTIVDTVAGALIGGALAGGGAFLGGALGGVIGGPVGAAIGGKIGGMLGGLAGDWVTKKFKESDLRDKIVDWTDHGVHDIWDAAAQTAQQVDQALDSVVDRVLAFF